MKKTGTISLVLAVAMLLTLLSGCGTEGTTPSSSLEDTTPSEVRSEPRESSEVISEIGETAEESQEDIFALPVSEELVTYTLFTGVDPRVVDLVNLDDLAHEYAGYSEITRLSNVSFDITAIAAMAYTEQFQLMTASNDYCDIIYGVEDNYATGANGALEDEVIIDLYDLIETYTPNLFDYIQQYSDLKARAINDNGQIGSLPLLLAEPGQENSGYTIRQDWLEAMNMDMPETMDALETYLYAANENYGAYVCITDEYTFPPLSTAMGFTLSGAYRENGSNELIFGWTSDKAYSYIEKIHQWYVDGLIPSDFTSVDMSSIQTGIASGTYSITSVNGASDLITLYSYTDDPAVVFTGLGSLPMDENSTIEYASANSIVKSTSEWSVSSQCEDPVPLMLLMNYMYTDEGRILNSWGTEGYSYDFDENHVPQWTDLIVNNPDGYSYVVARTVYAAGNLPGILDMSRDYYNFTELEWDAYDAFMGLNQDINNFPTAATNCMTSDESIAAAALYTDMETYIAEMVGQWIVGNQSLTQDSFQNFRNTLEDMGLAEYLGYYQTAYDRYLTKIA